jgi:23S rRNA pseudouridine2605 synthase
MEKKGLQIRREAGKNPGTGRSVGRGERPTGRNTAPGRGAKVGGVDLRALDRLEEAGLLSGEGRRLKAALSAGAPAGPKGQVRREASARRETPARREALARPQVVAGRPKAKRSVTTVAGAKSTGPAAPERLHKVMAQAGLASRRHSEELIQAGRVSVNGQVVTQLGTKVIPGKDLIEVDGRPLGKPEEPIYILLNKPKGYVTTLFDPQGRKKVTDLLGGEVGQRVYPVGRLDYDTEGLLLLTNDGELANALMHPSQQVKKTYIAKVRGVPNATKIAQLEQGVELEDGITAPADVKLIEAHGPNAATLSIRIHEGRNRQVRRMFEAVGHEVISLKRTTLGPIHLKGLKVGEWRELTPQELKDLRSAVGDKQAARSAYIAEKAALRAGKGRVRFGEGATPEAEGPTPVTGRPKPVMAAARPALEGAKPALGRPVRLGGDEQGYGAKPFARPRREDGARFADGGKPFGRPVREDGGKPYARPAKEFNPRPVREDGGKPYARPAKEFNPRPVREDGGKPYARPAREFNPRGEGGPRRPRP